MRRRLMVAALAACFGHLSIGGIAPITPLWAAAPALPLAAVYRAEIDPAPYWVSEKYDGVRALWDGRELRFRSGRRVPAPDWFIAALPPQALDGELWLGRGRFDELSAIVRKKQAADAEWRNVQYRIFEAPAVAGTFTERSARLRDIVADSGASWLHPVEQYRVADRAVLQQRLEEVVRGGGEGLMLHRADAGYRTGRSDDLLKLKPLLDAEATVIAHEPGKGHLTGMLGALRVRTATGREFRIGSGLDDGTRRHPPAIGTHVSFRYQELTPGGIPRFPRYWRRYEEF